MISAVGSDVGRIRQINEDCAAVYPNVRGHHIAIVADGVGGHQAGEIASAMALDIIYRELDSSSNEGESHWSDWIEEAIHTANREIYEFGMQNELEGMGTTVVAVACDERHVYVGHVGDSRLYHISDGRLIRKTEDHSLVQQLVNTGQINAEEAFYHPQKNIILRALGTDPETIVDTSSFIWSDNDSLLLCTDGLTDRIKEEQIASIISSHADVNEAVKELISAALSAGGEDNITVMLLQNNHQSTQPLTAVE